MSGTGQAIRRKKARLDRVLVYYDGPQILTLAGSRSSKWLCVSVPTQSAEGYEFPIFCVQVTADELERFVRGQADLSYFFRFRDVKDYRLGDLAKDEKGDFFLNSVVPQAEWWPEEGFFMEPESADTSNGVDTHDGAFGRVLTIPIDGEWEFQDFAAFSDHTSDCYSFLYSLDAARRGVAPKEAIAALTKPYEDYPWKGGASSLHMYDDLYLRTPANDRRHVYPRRSTYLRSQVP